MTTDLQPPNLVLAIVTIETWPPEEKPYPYPRKQSTPPKPQPWRSHEIFLVNRGEVGVNVQYNTGGFASFDDELVQTSVSSDAAFVEAGQAVKVETTDDGSFDFTFYYEVRVTPKDAEETWRGVFGISRWGHAPLDRMEDDGILQTKARIIRVKEWTSVAT